jgi:hypothetical protein
MPSNNSFKVMPDGAPQLNRKLMKVGPFAGVLFLSSCDGVAPQPEPVVVSIHELLTSPAEHHNGLVRLSGMAIVEFEGVFVCPDVGSMDRGEPSECLWMRRAEKTALELELFHQKQVELVGRFDAHRTGHMGLFGGELSVQSGAVVGLHDRSGFMPPPPPSSSANNSFKVTPEGAPQFNR